MGGWLGPNLDGRYAHVLSSTVFDDLPLSAAGARVDGVPYTIWQILQHMIWWQDWWIGRIDGHRPPMPTELAVSWPAEPAPPDEGALLAAIAHFRTGAAHAQVLAEGELEAPVAAEPPGVVGAELVELATHNSYHAGQVVLLRRLLSCWRRP